jgi:hypothetical protein
MHPTFILDHLQFAREHSFVRASRIYLNKELSREFWPAKSRVNPLHKGLAIFFSAWRIPLLWPFFKTGYKDQGDERWKFMDATWLSGERNAVAVNGYNENFKGWGPET